MNIQFPARHGKIPPCFSPLSHLVKPWKGFTLKRAHKIMVGLDNGMKASKILWKNVQTLEKSESQDAHGSLTCAELGCHRRVSQ